MEGSFRRFGIVRMWERKEVDKLDLAEEQLRAGNYVAWPKNFLVKRFESFPVGDFSGNFLKGRASQATEIQFYQNCRRFFPVGST